MLKYCCSIPKSSQINWNKYFQFTQWKKYRLKNVFLSFYRNIVCKNVSCELGLKYLSSFGYLVFMSICKMRTKSGLWKKESYSKWKLIFSLYSIFVIRSELELSRFVTWFGNVFGQIWQTKICSPSFRRMLWSIRRCLFNST